MGINILHETIVEQPDYLGVGIAVKTYLEPVGSKFLVYSQIEAWVGFDDSIRATSAKLYMEGHVDDIEQLIKLELPTEDAAIAVSTPYHELICMVADKGKQALKGQFFKTILGPMN